MKKTIALLLVLMLSLCLMAGCGNKENPEPAEPGAENGEETNASWSSGDFAADYINILTGDTYYVKYRADEIDYAGQPQDSITETAKAGPDVAAITTMGDISSTIIIKDYSYFNFVDHVNKVVYLTPDSPVNISTFPEEGYIFKDSGSAELFGVMHKYEEYTIEQKSGEDTAEIGTVRFFFDGDQLIGFETTIGGMANKQMEILEISSTVPQGIFDIPDDYVVINTGDIPMLEEDEIDNPENEPADDIIEQQ